MQRHRMVGLGVLVALSACRTVCQAQSAKVETLRCPDQESGCGVSNGTGVYYAEDGFAGIGRWKLMITHFVNTGTQVGFSGRYFDPTVNLWFPLPGLGLVYNAEYQGKVNLRAVAVSEADTVPTWTIEDPAASNPADRTKLAKDNDLLDLKLYIRFTVVVHGQGQPGTVDDPKGGRVTESYQLGFIKRKIDKPFNQTIHAYEMYWRELTGTPAVEYCVDRSGTADPVVFQQGVDINPVTGSVTRTGSTTGFVTLSCRQGAPAVVYSWSYPYQGPNTFYFDAGIHMKRASYCGDWDYYTTSPTLIHIADDQGINSNPIAQFEAWWSPTGAVCVEPGGVRNPSLVSSKGFTFSCNGHPLPKCVGSRPVPFLADGP